MKLQITQRWDLRLLALVLMALTIVALGTLFNTLNTATPAVAVAPAEHPSFARPPSSNSAEMPALKAAPPPVDPFDNPNGHARQAKRQEAELRFYQAMTMIRAGRFNDAVVAFDRVLELLPNNPDALTNRGFALLELNAPQQAFADFDQATDIDPTYATAYYGAAVSLEQLGDLEAALSGMRSFLHTTDMGKEKLWVARARSAIWEWEAKLERGPWGPTKGIPPGYTEEELRRDGQGVGVKIPLSDTLNTEGDHQYEIRSAKKIEIFER